MLRRVVIAAFLAAVALSSSQRSALWHGLPARENTAKMAVPHGISPCSVAFATTFGGLAPEGLAVSEQSATEGLTENLSDDSQNSKFPAIGRELFFKTMLAVLLVIALGVAAIVTCRKLLPRITNPLRGQIRILETAHLGPRKAIHLIEIDNQRGPRSAGVKRLLIGSTNENITMLADLTGQQDFKFET